jgi:hypothetical protein
LQQDCRHFGGPLELAQETTSRPGGLLLAQGRASVSNDSLALNVDGLAHPSNMIFLQGTSAAGGGAGAPFNDGILCVGGTIRRLAGRQAINGFASLGAGNAGDPPLSALGLVPAIGGVFYYQAWYRNIAPFCTSATDNTSNAVSVTWTL